MKQDIFCKICSLKPTQIFLQFPLTFTSTTNKNNENGWLARAFYVGSDCKSRFLGSFIANFYCDQFVNFAAIIEFSTSCRLVLTVFILRWNVINICN